MARTNYIRKLLKHQILKHLMIPLCCEMKLYTAKANLLLFNILFITKENFYNKKHSLVFQCKNFSVQYFLFKD